MALLKAALAQMLFVAINEHGAGEGFKVVTG
jgi:hypothetical protein